MCFTRKNTQKKYCKEISPKTEGNKNELQSCLSTAQIDMVNACGRRNTKHPLKTMKRNEWKEWSETHERIYKNIFKIKKDFIVDKSSLQLRQFFACLDCFNFHQQEMKYYWIASRNSSFFYHTNTSRHKNLLNLSLAVFQLNRSMENEPLKIFFKF